MTITAQLKKVKTMGRITAAVCGLSCLGVANAAVTVAVPQSIGLDFESAGVGATPPTDWSVVNTGSGTYATVATGGNPSQHATLTWTGSTQLRPGAYLVNDGSTFSALTAITGTFDFQVPNINYATGNFVIGDVAAGLSGVAGDYLNVRLQRATFGARAELRDGDDTILSPAPSNAFGLVAGQWLNATFSWTPTSGSTGDFAIQWSNTDGGAQTEGFSTTGYTFSNDLVSFGFGQGRNSGGADTTQFDNFQIDGFEVVSVALPEPSTAIFSVFGILLLRGMRSRLDNDGDPEYC